MPDMTSMETTKKPDDARSWPSRGDVARILIVVAGFAFLYHTAIIGLVGSWRNSPTYSFGCIIPLISIYLAWQRRDRLAGLDASTAPLPGFILLACSLVLFLIGKFGGILILQQIALFISLPALVLLFLGGKIAKALAFPLAYLVFMLPVWDFIIERLQFPFQLYSANIAGRLLQLIGVPAHQHGIIIEIPNLVIEVARECSGVNFLISTIAIGIPLAALYFDSWYKRALLLVVSVFIAISGNGLRAALIALFAYKGYSTNLHGPQHVFYGYFVSVLGLLVLFAGVYLFGNNMSSASKAGFLPDTERPMDSRRSGKGWGLVIVTTVLFLAAGYAAHFRTAHATPLKNNLRLFPETVGGFKALDQPPVLDAMTGNGADEELSRRYSDGSGSDYNLYVGYYAFQEQGKVLTNYRIREHFRDARKYSYPSAFPPDGSINAYVADIRGKRHLVLYWFIVDGKNVADMYSAKINTMVEGLLRNRTNGSIVVITTEYDGNSDIPSQIRSHSGFVKNVSDLLNRHLDAF